jgi:hypothetical protein
MEAIERQNYPYYIILGYTPPKGTLGNLVVAPSDGCASTASLRSTNATHATMPRVLRFEVSGSHPQGTPVRPMLLTSQTGSHRSDCPSAVVMHVRSSVLVLWLSQVTHCGEPLQTPRIWCSRTPISTHDLAATIFSARTWL